MYVYAVNKSILVSKINFRKCNFPVTPHVRLSVGWSVCLADIILSFTSHAHLLSLQVELDEIRDRTRGVYQEVFFLP